MSKLLVIGGTGLISGRVVGQLHAQGAAVTVYNRGKTPPPWQSSEVARLIGDRTDRRRFIEQIRQHGPWDCVIDMICSDPKDAEALRDACKGIAGQVIFCSTTNVYPKPAVEYPVPESHPLGAAYQNGIEKAACEQIHRQAEMDGCYAVTVIRPGHSYGETGGILHSLGQCTCYLERLKKGQPIIVHGDGQSLWSCLHVEDVASLFAAAASRDVAVGKTYHACGLEWFTWNQYHERVAEAIAAPAPRLVHIPTNMLTQLSPQLANHATRSLQYPGIYDMTAAQKEPGFVPQVPFRDGVRRVVKWLTAHGQIENCPVEAEYADILRGWHDMLGSQVTDGAG